MNILWAGGEDIDFPIVGSSSVSTTAGYFRSGWARCAVGQNGTSSAMGKSLPFSGGAVANAWLSYRVVTFNLSFITNSCLCGFGLSGTNDYIGVGGDSTGTKWCIVKYNGTTRTVLATESGSDMNTNLNRVDIQVSSFGVTGTVNLYVNNTLIVTYTGDLTSTGMTTNFDSVFLGVTSSAATTDYFCSEIVVADSDTRALLGVNTLALTGAGTTHAWTNNTYTNINGINYSDASPTFVNTTAQDQEYTVGTVQPSVYSVVGVVQSARLATPTGSTPTHVKLGYGSGGTGSFGTGATKTPTVGFSTFQQLDQINPITSTTWVSADLAAPLQLDMQSS